MKSKITGTDKDKKPRKLIVFDLVPLSTSAESTVESLQPVVADALAEPFETLRQSAYAASKTEKVPSRSGGIKNSWYVRSEKVRVYVLARSKGICEACDSPAPFYKKDGTPYLEPHHTTRLADEGPDHPAWVAAICPNCHRRIHSGNDGDQWNMMLKQRLKEKESVLGPPPPL